jgi:ketosteroid isomerase-like protein
MKGLLTMLGCCLLLTISAQNKPEQAIRNILSQQTIAWNQGNLDAFMKGYWESDSLVFVGKSGLTYGYRQTLNNYKKNYPDTAHMGKLQFDILAINRLADNYYFVIGKFMLQRSVGDVSGHFTLLVKKINSQWLIINDHSS